MHPPENALFPGMALDLPSSLLMINFDEHGGTYDHVPPPPVPSPGPAGSAGQYGFTFDRSGIRVPAIAISAWIPEKTVINGEYRNSSVIATLRQHWSLGAPVTARDAIAPSLAPVLSPDTPRPPEDWPEVTAQPVPFYDQSLLPSERC
jgi:phospholipase C